MYLSLDEENVPLKWVGSGNSYNYLRLSLTSKPATFAITNEDLKDGGL